VAPLIGEIHQLHAHICQALADPKRILILYALDEQPRNVTELSEMYDIPQPTVSRHLKVLRERGLASSERQGNAIIYSLTDRRVIEALDIMRGLLADLLSHNAELADQIDGSSG
jgi:DNA-binding transcriptional ArsR family regulator